MPLLSDIIRATAMPSWIECVMNVSEGRALKTVDAIANAIAKTPGVALLDVSSDPDHHRSVLTFAGEGRDLLPACLRGAEEAVRRIDLNSHRGAHPRIGAVDVIPFIPLRSTSMSDCIELARQLGKRIAEDLELPVYLYGEAAASPVRRDLSWIRLGGAESLRETIASDPRRRPDFGPARLHPTAGAVAVGAREVLIAFNVVLKNANLETARRIARLIRESSGGLPGVKALGIFLESRGLAQVSMNLTDYRKTSPQAVFDRIESEASRVDAEVIGSELVGLAPRQALGENPRQTLKLESFRPGQVLETALENALSGQESWE